MGLATIAVSLGFAAGAEAAKLPKFSVTNISNPPRTRSRATPSPPLGVVENEGKKGGKATVRISLRSDDVDEHGPIALGHDRRPTRSRRASRPSSASRRRSPRTSETARTSWSPVRLPPRARAASSPTSRSTVTSPPPVFQPGLARHRRRPLSADGQRRLRRRALRHRAGLRPRHEPVRGRDENHDDGDRHAEPERVHHGLPGHRRHRGHRERSAGRRLLARRGGARDAPPRRRSCRSSSSTRRARASSRARR